MSMYDVQKIGKNIAQQRKERGLTQQDLADMLEMNSKYISAIETGRKTPKLETFIQIINALNTTADSILFHLTPAGISYHSNVVYEKIQKLPEAEQNFILDIIEGIVDNFTAHYENTKGEKE